MRILLNGKGIDEPKIWFGVLYGFVDKVKKKTKKFEEIMNYLEYYEKTFFTGLPNIDYEDEKIIIKGNLLSKNLFDINLSQL